MGFEEVDRIDNPPHVHIALGYSGEKGFVASFFIHQPLRSLETKGPGFFGNIETSMGEHDLPLSALPRKPKYVYTPAQREAVGWSSDR